MKKKVINAIIILLFAVGVFTLFYPSVTTYVTEMGTNEMIAQFQEEHAAEQTEASETVSFKESDQLYDDMQIYNMGIYQSRQVDFEDPFSYETPAFNLSDHGIEDGIFGYISIPKMNVEMPILLGATKANLFQGLQHVKFINYWHSNSSPNHKPEKKA